MLKDILAISGQPGLYKLISNTKNGIIVENLETKKRMPSYATAKVSALEDISIYTQDGDDKPLGKVLKSIKEKEDGKQTISAKASANDLKAFFTEVMPEYDKEQVYVSDIKKVIQWYNILQTVGLLENIGEEVEEETKTEEVEKAKEA